MTGPRPKSPDPAQPTGNDARVGERPSPIADASERVKSRAELVDDDALPIDDLPPRQNVRGG